MSDLRKSLLRYLDAKQHLWNAYFLPLVRDIRDCAPLDDFVAVDHHLFLALVCQPLDIKLPDGFVRGSSVIAAIEIKSRTGLSEIKLMLSRPSAESNNYWDIPKAISTDKLELQFIDFFQWNLYDFLSMSKVRGVVKSCPTEPSFERAPSHY